ncbi:proline racemase family protein [Alkalihalobacillus sp. TS-13]|uniref:proline racemase family protein n=1 Tax=Alkalihalobacillus sp. TS-13 TaxID=2842455 RepID=UPI001C88B998|nr:proline racemase family protein [Alkalihalobacillus sp. TS-13]
MEFKRMLTTVDTHTAGEPLRIITGGLPMIKGDSILEKRAYFTDHLDTIRTILMHEPRGHHGMYGCIVTPPENKESDFGVLFMHNEGLSTMCGHGIIGVVTAGIEMGFLETKGEGSSVYTIDSPAGKITAEAIYGNHKVSSVSFINVPSFVYKEDFEISLDHKTIKVDIAFGGAFYAIVQAKDLDLQVEIQQLSKIQKWGKLIKEEIEKTIDVKHPLEDKLQGIYGVIFSDQPKKEESHLRNVTVFADQQIDRSPCGTGTAARMAALYQKGELAEKQPFVHESIITSQLKGEIIESTKIGPFDAIIPKISGTAFITGSHQFFIDPSDPLSEGFLLG